MPAVKSATRSAPRSRKAPTRPARTPKADKAVRAAADSADTKADKPRKRVKPVRDSFTMPADDFGLIATLKVRALAHRREAKKSELLRAGLHALAALEGAELVVALDRLAPVKTGRPKKDR